MIYTWSTIGHEKQLTQLEREIQSGQLSHAYLFVGPSGIGKMHIARRLAMLLQCPNNFCRTCVTCTQIEKNIHQDTIQISAPKDNEGESIKINTIRELIDRVQLSTHSNRKIVIIDGLERLTPEAANALLKTLEEPPSQTLIIGTIHDIHATLPTIVSRMRALFFKKPSSQEIHRALTQLYPEVPQETIASVVSLSFGASGVARALVEDPERLSELKKEYDHIAYLYEQEGLAERMVHMGELSKEEGNAVPKFLDTLILFLHEKLHRSVDNEHERQRIADHIEKAHAARQLYEKNINTRLVLEHLHVNLLK